VDNFLFATTAGVTVRLICSGGEGLLDYRDKADNGKAEPFNDYSEALLCMADVLSGRLGLPCFEESQNPTQTQAPYRLMDVGQFYVQSIGMGTERESFVAVNNLVFKTGEGRELRLDMDEKSCSLRLKNKTGKAKQELFLPSKMDDALRRMARVLAGDILTTKFGE